MSNPLHAHFYADQALFDARPITENVCVARNTYRLRIMWPEMAARILPGQFIMVRLHGYQDPLLGRAFALYDVVKDKDGRPEGFDIVYLVMGKLTSCLRSRQPGELLDIWGPLGNGFKPRPTQHLVMVAGGVGFTPFPAVASEYLGTSQYGTPHRQTTKTSHATLCYGAASADLLAGLEDFTTRNVDVRVSTDDGTAGHQGFVTEVLEQVLDERQEPTHIVSCGPEPMLARVCEIAAERNISCEVSLEAPMACGIGVCFSCVAKVREENGNWDYKRTCVEGPVFDAEKLEW